MASLRQSGDYRASRRLDRCDERARSRQFRRCVCRASAARTKSANIAGAVETSKSWPPKKPSAKRKKKSSRTSGPPPSATRPWPRMADEFDAAVGGIVKAAMAGDFSQRVVSKARMAWSSISAPRSIRCARTSARRWTISSPMLDALADGDLTQRITADYQGKFAVLKDNANKTASGSARPSPRSRPRRAKSPTPRPKSRPAPPTCRSAPKSRRRAWKRPRRRWKRSPRP